MLEFILFSFIMKRKFNIIVWQEWNNFVTRVLENNVSSFWTTRDETLKNTYEALELYYEKEKSEDDIPYWTFLSILS